MCIRDSYFINRTFFDDVSADMLLEGFSDILTKTDIPSAVHLEIEKTFLLFTPIPSIGPMSKILAMTRLHDMLGLPQYREVLITDYGFDDRQLHRLAGEADAFRPAPPPPPPTPPVSLQNFSGRLLARELGQRVRTHAKQKVGRLLGRNGNL